MSGGTKVAKAAGIIMVAMIASRVIGYVRDVVISAQFGQNSLTDAYNAAFSVPDFLYYLLVGGALSSAFIPVFSSYIATDKEEDGWIVASTIFNIVMILMFIGIIFGLIYTPFLVKLLVPGFNPDTFGLTVVLTRVMFAQTFFMALNGISMGILNSYKHFLAPALGSVVYNVGIIVVGVILSPYIGIMGFSIGVVVGAALNFAVQFPALRKIGLKYRPIINLRHPGVKKIGILILPVLIGLSVTHFNLFVNQNLASGLPEGYLTALRMAQRLMQLPIGIFAIAVAIAMFPTLTGQAAKKEITEFKKTVSLGIRTIIFITLPAAAGLIALKTPLVRVLYQQGKFTSENTEATAYALLFYCLGLFAYAALQFLNRVFYALQDTLTPVVVGLLTVAVNIGLNFLLIKPLYHGGLALAYSIAGIVNMLLLLYVLKLKLGTMDGRKIFTSFLKILGISTIMGVAVYWGSSITEGFVNVGTKVGQITQVTVGVSVGVLVYTTLALLIKMEEAQMAKGIMMRRFTKSK